MNLSEQQSDSLAPSPGAEAGPELEPVYFGPSRALFGCLHAPRGTPRPGSGVVICPPAGPEYVRCHRSLRVLAAMLAAEGYPVLRFDYFGTGDSLGEGEDASIGRWQQDLADAVRFMRGRYRATRLTLLGVRLGATLAVRHLLEQGGVEQLVLWDPVVNGQRFIDELRERTADHERWLVHRHGPRPAAVQADGPRDLFGFRYSPSFMEELAAIDLLSAGGEARADTFILDNCEDPQTASLAEHLRHAGLAVELDRLEAPKVWLAEPFQGLVSAQSLKRINSWVAGRGA